MSRQVTHDGLGSLEVRFPFDRALVDRIKSLPQRRWNADERFWSVPERDVILLVDLLCSESFRFDRATQDLYFGMGGTRTLPEPEPARAPARTGPTLPGLFDPPAPAEGDSAVSVAHSTAAAAGAAATRDFTVSHLNERVRETIRAAFGSTVWLVGEISGFNKSAHRRHVSFELVERADDGRVISKIPAVLFGRTRKTVEAGLQRAGDPFRLEDEVSVRVQVNVDLYVPWGQYRVVVEDLDVNYTLGEAARRREEIVRRLAEAGLVGRNSGLELPALPLRVGLITSLGSDAFNDVVRTLQESGFAFELTAHGARVQGHSTEPSVLNALDWFRERIDRFDVVLICRGGGSRTDLVWFDSDALGRAVAEFPIPVLVGIGHEQDQSVLDAVGRSCKTPTAAAARVVQRAQESLDRLETLARETLSRATAVVRDERQRGREHGRRLTRATLQLLRHESSALDQRRRRTVLGSRRVLAGERDRLARWTALIPRDARIRLEQQRSFLDHALRSVSHASRRDLRAAGERVARLASWIGPRSAQRLHRENERNDQRERRLHLVHPRRVVDRGYAILRLADGKVLAREQDAPAGAGVRAELKRGRLRLRSEGPEHATGDG